jgi:hypothetical protein
VREYPVFTVDANYLESLLTGTALIKLDIEGAEPQVLNALRPLLTRYRPHIILEVLCKSCDALNELDFLGRCYQLFQLTGDGPLSRAQFVGDREYRHRDYLLVPRDCGQRLPGNDFTA